MSAAHADWLRLCNCCNSRIRWLRHTRGRHPCKTTAPAEWIMSNSIIAVANTWAHCAWCMRTRTMQACIACLFGTEALDNVELRVRSLMNPNLAGIKMRVPRCVSHRPSQVKWLIVSPGDCTLCDLHRARKQEQLRRFHLAKPAQPVPQPVAVVAPPAVVPFLTPTVCGQVTDEDFIRMAREQTADWFEIMYLYEWAVVGGPAPWLDQFVRAHRSVIQL